MSERDEIIAALVEKFTDKYYKSQRNYDWDWEKPEGPDNEYYIYAPYTERLKAHPMVNFIAGDGQRSTRIANFGEIADAILEWKKNADQ